jgi:hypothetical protein
MIEEVFGALYGKAVLNNICFRGKDVKPQSVFIISKKNKKRVISSVMFYSFF